MLVIIIGLLAYSNTFDGTFHYDDNEAIVNNPVIKNLQYFIHPSEASIFKTQFQYRNLKARYIAYLTFALNYKFNGLNVTGYHVVNLMIHLANALLVYYLMLLSFRTAFLSRSGVRGYSGEIALVTSLLFAAHPIQTQAVTYIVQRAASLCTMFYLLSILLYIKWRLTIPGRGVVKYRGIIFLYAASIVSSILAMKTKEIAFTLPLMIAFYEFMFFDGVIKKRLFYLIPFFLAMVVIPLGFMDARMPLTEGMASAARDYTSIPRADYFITQFRVLVTYIRLIFFPVAQNLDYNHQVYHSFFAPQVVLSFLFLSAILSAGIYLFYLSKAGEKSLRLIAFGIIWFFVTLSVESSVIPIPHVIFEHRLYLASYGIFLAITSAVFIIYSRLGSLPKKAAAVFITAIIAAFAVTTYARNNVWKDEISLWKDVISKNTGSAVGNYNLGKAYQLKGMLDNAVEHYNAAIRLNPYQIAVHNELGNVYKSLGFIDRAMEEYQAVIRLNPAGSGPHGNQEAKDLEAAAHYNIGLIYKSQGLIDNAVEEYEAAINLNPVFPEAHSNLGILYEYKGLTDKAIEHYHETLRLDPMAYFTYYNLGAAYQSKNLIEMAAENYKAVIRIKPDWDIPHLSLGRIYLQSGNVKDARIELEETIRLNPQNHEAGSLLETLR